MKITELGRDPKSGKIRYLIDAPVWIPGKKHGTHIKRRALGSTDLAIKIAEIKTLSGSSLTAKTFADCSAHYERQRGYGSKADVFKRNLAALGKYKVDKRFAPIYAEYIRRISENHATNTVNNYRICIRSVLYRAFKDGLIESVPVRDFGIETMVERDRIWTNDERTRIYNAIVATKSHLYWSVRLAEKNPIRGISDLWNLKATDFVEVGAMSPCIRFFPRKTRKKRDVPTYLIELDQDLMEHFRKQKIEFPDCPYLFPRVRGGKWSKMGSPKRHWRYLMERAEVRNFHFHDLRHVATTYMLEKRDANGQRVYDVDDLRDLGLFYSQRAVEIYRNRKAERVAERVRHSTFIAPELTSKNVLHRGICYGE